MKNRKKDTPNSKEDVQNALQDLQDHNDQDLSKENLGNEPEEQPSGDPNNPFRLKGFDDKRPENEDIDKGWTVDSNTSRGPQDLNTDKAG